MFERRIIKHEMVGFKKYIHSFLLVFFLWSILISPGFSIQKSGIDSLKNELRKEVSEVKRFDIYQQIFDLYYPAALDSAEYYVSKAIDSAKKNNNLELEIRGTGLLIRILNRSGGRDKILALSKYTLSKAVATQDMRILQPAWANMGIVYTLTRQYDSAAHYRLLEVQAAQQLNTEPNEMISILATATYPLIKNDQREVSFDLLLKAQQLIEQHDDIITDDSRTMVYEKFRNSYAYSKKLEKAIEYSKKALDVKLKKGDTRDAGSEAYMLGVFYKSLGNYDKAAEYLIYASKHYTHIDNTDVGFILHSRLGYTMQHLGRYDEALRAFQQQLLIANNLGKVNYIAETYCSIGDLYLTLNQTDNAKKTLQKAIQLYNESLKEGKSDIDDVQMLMIYAGLSRADSAMGDFKSSMVNMRKALELNVKIADKRTKSKIEELQVKYETEKKDNEIELLNEKAQVTALVVQKKTLFNWTFAIISLLLIAIIGIIYNRYRLKEKSMKIIEQKSRENATLVQEVHHRVKNNLQIMLSLLGTQSNLLIDEEAKKLIEESQNRIKSMALIHKNLYQSGNMVMVNTESYFDELATNVLSSFKDCNQQISLKTDISSHEIKMALAVPLGLILNELLTNSMKYAFRDTKNGELSISFGLTDDKNLYYLRVMDNGTGLPEDFNINNTNSFGLKLVEGLTHQLNGSMQIIKEVGTRFDIYFKDLGTAVS